MTELNLSSQIFVKGPILSSLGTDVIKKSGKSWRFDVASENFLLH